MIAHRAAFSIAAGVIFSFPGWSHCEPVVSRIGLAGCHRQDWPAPAMFRYVEAKPDLMIWLGDNIYADTRDNVAYIENCYGMLGAHPAFEQLRKHVPMAAIWDDHDYGLDNVGRNYPLKEQSKQLFRSFWALESLIWLTAIKVSH